MTIFESLDFLVVDEDNCRTKPIVLQYTIGGSIDVNDQLCLLVITFYCRYYPNLFTFLT